jgi:hypothetical protein
MLLLARVVRAVTAVVVGILVVATVFVVVDANESHLVVSWFEDAGSWLAGPFKDLFSIGNEKAAVAVNWGIAALVYSWIGKFAARRLRAVMRLRRGSLSATG